MNDPSVWALFRALGTRPGSDGELAALGPTAWRRVAELALRVQCGPLLWWRLRSSRQDHLLPERVAERLGRQYAWNVTRNAALFEERDWATRLLAEAGIRALAVKGADLAASLYDSPGARTIGDIDLLVDRHDLGPAQQVLRQAGCQDRAVRPGAEDHRHLPPVRRPGGFWIEVHWTLSQGVAGEPEPERLGVWERSRPLGGGPSQGMDPLDALLFTCQHLAVHHGFATTNGVSALADVAAFLERGAVDPAQIPGRAREWGIRAAVFLCLWLCRTHLRVEVPDATLAALEVPGWEAHADSALRTLFFPGPLRSLLLPTRPTLNPPPVGSGLHRTNWAPSVARYVRSAAFPPRDDAALEFAGLRHRPWVWFAYPLLWTQLGWSHLGVLRLPFARDQLRARVAEQEALLVFVRPDPSR